MNRVGESSDSSSDGLSSSDDDQVDDHDVDQVEEAGGGGEEEDEDEEEEDEEDAEFCEESFYHRLVRNVVQTSGQQWVSSCEVESDFGVICNNKYIFLQADATAATYNNLLVDHGKWLETFLFPDGRCLTPPYTEEGKVVLYLSHLKERGMKSDATKHMNLGQYYEVLHALNALCQEERGTMEWAEKLPQLPSGKKNYERKNSVLA